MNKNSRIFMNGFPMLILLSLEQYGPLTAVTIAKILKEKTGETVAKGAIHTTLKNLQAHGFVNAARDRQDDDRGYSRIVMVFSLLDEGREKMEKAVTSVLTLVDREFAVDILDENEDWGRRGHSNRSPETRPF